MFTFFHVKPKITLDCFTTEKAIHDFVPITRAIKTVPDWWKNLPREQVDIADSDRHFSSNMKTCTGFVDLYKRGFMLEAWGDFNFTVTPDRKYEYQLSSGSLQEHARSQYGKGFSNHEHAKLVSPWRLRCKENHYFHFSAATWNLADYDFTIVPGVLEFYYQTTTNVNMMIPIRKEEYKFTVPAGTALAHIVPLNESYNYHIKNHLVSAEEMKTVERNMRNLYSGYRGFKKLMARNKNRAKERCPFS